MKTLKYTIYALVLLAVVGAAAVGYGAWRDGYRAYAVKTGSMTPTYPTGALVIDAPVTKPVKVGDVITFQTADGLVTHRVHDVLDDGIRTKGDGNRTVDAWTVRPDRVIGVVTWGAAYLGYVFVFFQQPTGAPALVLLGLSVWFAWILFFPTKEPAAGAAKVSVDTSEPAAEDDWSLLVLPGAGNEPARAGAHRSAEAGSAGSSSDVVLPDHSSRSGLLSA